MFSGLSKNEFSTPVHFEAWAVVGMATLLKYWAPWCGSCRLYSPAINRLVMAHAENIELVDIDVSKQPELAEKAGVLSLPTLSLVVDGEEVLRLTGLMSYEKLEKAVLEVLS
jgi:thioredoxin 1